MKELIFLNAMIIYIALPTNKYNKYVIFDQAKYV